MPNDEELPLELLTLAEPYRIKMTEAMRLPSREQRKAILEKAFHSIVYLDSNDVFIDLSTDSGTGSMSDRQWAGMMRGDEAYIRSRSFFEMESAVQKVMGYPFVVPTHQGRAAEHIFMEVNLGKKKDKGEQQIVLNNTHFDTTRAHVMHQKALPADLVADAVWDFDKEHPFKGNFDLERLDMALKKHGDKVPFVLITVLNNFACSSPVSMENIREASALARKYGKPVYFDACRFAENAWFIKTREKGYQDKAVADIVHEMFSHGEGCWMSAKKDAMVNIGGFLALKDEKLARECQERLVLYEGFPTYGGLAGRDLEAVAVGLLESIDEAHLASRTRQTAYLAELFEKEGIKVSKPAGGSGVFVDVGSLYGHLPAEKFPSIALCCDLYLEGGIRAAAYPFHFNTYDKDKGEFVMKDFEFARFALPRRTYTKGHMEYIAKVMARVKERAPRNKGYRITYRPEVLEHFFSKFAPLE
jgi:tryptophanase